MEEVLSNGSSRVIVTEIHTDEAEPRVTVRPVTEAEILALERSVVPGQVNNESFRNNEQ